MRSLLKTMGLSESEAKVAWAAVTLIALYAVVIMVAGAAMSILLLNIFPVGRH